MDEVDRKLLMLMAGNPRMHYRDLATRVGISRQAVHQRIRVLTKMGVIKGTEAGISFPYLDAVSVIVFGRCSETLTEDVFDTLGQSELTRRVVIASDNLLYSVGELRSVSELEGYVRLVKRVSLMRDPAVGIFCLDEELMPRYQVDGGGKRVSDNRKLSALDLRIISALKDDARRSLADIAEVTGLSAKTIRRHMDDMIADGILEIHLLADTPSGGDMLFVIHVELEDSADRIKVGRRLLRIFEPLDAYGRTFSNLPALLMIVFWAGDINQIRRIMRESCREEGVRGVTLNYGYFERVYKTWRDEIPTPLTEPTRARTRTASQSRGEIGRGPVRRLSRVT